MQQKQHTAIFMRLKNPVAINVWLHFAIRTHIFVTMNEQIGKKTLQRQKMLVREREKIIYANN